MSLSMNYDIKVDKMFMSLSMNYDIKVEKRD